MNNIVSVIKDEVMAMCEALKCKTGQDDWNHVNKVAEVAVQLAKEAGADEEIALLGAYLHDISNTAQYGSNQDHHIHSAEMAEQMLRKHGYPAKRTERVTKCVLHHRSSRMMPKETPEEVCVADADAVSHFYDIPGLFRVAYVLKSLSRDEGAEWVKQKLTKDYFKLSPRSKEIYKERYDLLQQLF